jgi:hypothetical protein
MQDIDMLRDKLNPVVNTPTPSCSKGKINSRLLAFVDEIIPVFQTEFKALNRSSEEELTERLVKTLAYYANRKMPSFIFQQETIQKQEKGQKRKVDIGVFLHYRDNAPFFTIEAKRLPTLPKKREREYVIGENNQKYFGGIERFKRNLHGVGLNESGMIAYVQSGDCFSWSKQINSWIQELIDNPSSSTLKWTNIDLLTCIENKPYMYCKCQSVNTKVDRSSVILHHYLVDITGQ